MVCGCCFCQKSAARLLTKTGDNLSGIESTRKRRLAEPVLDRQKKEKVCVTSCTE